MKHDIKIGDAVRVLSTAGDKIWELEVQGIFLGLHGRVEYYCKCIKSGETSWFSALQISPLQTREES
jgi:hypothetical protein